MKYFKSKFFAVTALVCLLPIIPGLILWNDLPESMVIHFNFYGRADGFAPKWVAVFILPVLMVAFQFICCAVSDANVHKPDGRKKGEKIARWIIPFLTVILQTVIFAYSLINGGK